MTLAVVVGTGTGVGKTTLTASILRALRPLDPLGWKPIETGSEADETALAEACGRREPALYRFDAPISPHLAARREGKTIALERIVQRAAQLRSEGPLLLETAGGLFSPLDDDGNTNAELAQRLRPETLLLVAPNRLGVLHDVEACLRGARHLAFDGLVLTHPAKVDASTDSNSEELRRRTRLPVYEVFLPEIGAPMVEWIRERLRG